jgi:hypothetical protein
MHPIKSRAGALIVENNGSGQAIYRLRKTRPGFCKSDGSPAGWLGQEKQRQLRLQEAYKNSNTKPVVIAVPGGKLENSGITASHACPSHVLF